MSDISRKIVVSADASSFKKELADASSGIAENFSRLQAPAKSLGENFSSVFKRMQEDTKILYKDLEATADSMKLSGRERIKFLENEINLLKRVSEEETRLAALRINFNRQNALNEKRPLSEIRDQQSRDTAEMQVDRGMSSAQNSILKDLLNETRDKNDDAEIDGSPNGGGEYGAVIAGKAKGAATGAGMGTANALGMGNIAALLLGNTIALGGIISEMVSEGAALETSALSLRGLTGQRKGFDIGSGTSFGMNMASYSEYAKNFATATGSSIFGEGGKTLKSQLGFEKTYALGDGQTFGLNNMMRSDNYLPAQAMTEMVELFKKADVFNMKRGDFTLVGEKVQDLARMTDLARHQMNETNAADSMRLMAAFGTVGGSFSDNRQVETIQKINNSITNPNNEFTQAALYRSLRQSNPNASLFELMKKQEKGIFGEGNLESFLSTITKGGANETTFLNVSKALGLGLEQSQLLTMKFLNDPSFRQNLNSEMLPDTQYDNSLGTETEKYIRSGSKGVGDMQKFRANMSDRFAQNGMKFVDEAKPLMDLGLDFADILTSGIVKGFTLGMDMFNGVLDVFGGGSSKTKENVKEQTPQSKQNASDKADKDFLGGGGDKMEILIDLMRKNNMLLQDYNQVKNETYWG